MLRQVQDTETDFGDIEEHRDMTFYLILVGHGWVNSNHDRRR